MNIYTILKKNKDIQENQWKYVETYFQDEREEIELKDLGYDKEKYILSKNYPYVLKGEQILCLPENIETDEEKLEKYQNEVRELRKPKLEVYDKLAVNFSVGIEKIDSKKWEEIKKWRQTWLLLPDNIDITLPIEKQIPETPKEIQYYETI